MMGLGAMFHSLDEQIEETEGGRSPTSARIVHFVEAAILALLVFGTLYLAIVALE